MFLTFREHTTSKWPKISRVHFLEGTKCRSEGSEKMEVRGPKDVGLLGRVEHPLWALVAPMSSVFVSVASSWPKTDYKNSPPRSFARRRRRNTKPRNIRQKAVAGEDWRGETPPDHLRKTPPSPLRSLHQHHRQDQHHLHHHLRDPLHPLIVWDCSNPSYCLSTVLHVCELLLVIVLWGDYIFRLCCTTYAIESYHVFELWVVLSCSWGHRMDWQWFHYSCLSIGQVFIFDDCLVVQYMSARICWGMHEVITLCNGLGRTWELTTKPMV